MQAGRARTGVATVHSHGSGSAGQCHACSTPPWPEPARQPLLSAAAVCLQLPRACNMPVHPGPAACTAPTRPVRSANCSGCRAGTCIRQAGRQAGGVRGQPPLSCPSHLAALKLVRHTHSALEVLAGAVGLLGSHPVTHGVRHLGGATKQQQGRGTASPWARCMAAAACMEARALGDAEVPFRQPEYLPTYLYGRLSP